MSIHMDARDEKRGRKKAARSDRAAYSDRSTFINRELTSDEKLTQREWREDLSGVVAAWAAALSGGYRLNTKWDDYSDSFAAFLIPEEGGDNSGFILTGRGGTPYRAVAEVLFKHEYVFRGVWAEDGIRPNRESDPDF